MHPLPLFLFHDVELVLQCLWTTQVQNGDMLSDAFKKCKNVILFFSVNKSQRFQGYARMASSPSAETTRPEWMTHFHWDTTPPFRIEWLSKTPVDFHPIGHLTNKYNEDLPVLVGRDGQEIDDECGRAFVALMKSKAEEIRDRNRSRSPGAARRGGRPARGGRGGRYIKREEDHGRW
jgi:YTH domain-containing protein 1